MSIYSEDSIRNALCGAVWREDRQVWAPLRAGEGASQVSAKPCRTKEAQHPKLNGL